MPEYAFAAILVVGHADPDEAFNDLATHLDRKLGPAFRYLTNAHVPSIGGVDDDDWNVPTIENAGHALRVIPAGGTT